jgi:ribosome maturation factor RimP
MNILLRNITEFADRITQDLDLLLIDITIRGDERNRVVEIFIDGEMGISAETCAEVSNKIKELIEEQDLIKGKYRLEVSSPGIDRSLKFLKQFPKHINRKFEIVYVAEESTVKVVSKLLKIEGEDLFFFDGKKELIINFNKIKSAKVQISF